MLTRRMSKSVKKQVTTDSKNSLPKSFTGIRGLDEITNGGLPSGRPTLVCGGPGCGKTLLAIEFIAKGILEYNEPGVIMAFEEKAEELAQNVASLGFDLEKMQRDKKLRVDYVHIDKSEIEETGEYGLDGLFIRLGHAIDSVGAKRVVLDTMENLFFGFSNQGILRSEIRKLFQFLKSKNVTALITGEKGETTFTRQGLEEYVSDCVILLDHRVTNKISTRLLRIVKYRGTVHGTNEYPFLIDKDGISVLPITSLELTHPITTERISSGIAGMDKMLDSGKGFFRGTSILVSGTAGTGKTSIAGTIADATCKRKERCLFLAFEESPAQIIRNMKSIGVDLQAHVDDGLLVFHPSRPTQYGLEMHLISIINTIDKFSPHLLVMDPITNFVNVGSMSEVKSMLVRLLDYLQRKQVTALFTALTLNSNTDVQPDEGVASLVDIWISIKDVETNGERNRSLYIMKARGMQHSNQIREFIITSAGLQLVDVFIGPAGVLVGSARQAQQLQDVAATELRSLLHTRKEREIKRKKIVLDARIASLEEEFESLKDELTKTHQEEELKKQLAERKQRDHRQNPSPGTTPKPGRRKK
jgi:circadian clock protein KaiC